MKIWFILVENFNDGKQHDNFCNSEDNQASHRGHEEQPGADFEQTQDCEMDMADGQQSGQDNDQQVQDYRQDDQSDHQGQDEGHFDDNQGQDNSGNQHGEEDMNVAETNDNQV